ncbi:hypothetical protein ACH9DO_08675 [Kocuria sp. M1N1S27]|uniref:hypothetical protein n=1 Tax=Kocuria kalidii TaxID=3376283 RepID=UPI003788E4AE
MSAPTAVTQHGTDPSRDPAPRVEPCSCLGPAEAFPAALGALSMDELQVLHSRICRQLDREYLEAPDGPHPCTADRLQEVLDELDVRDAT